jgi:uncharacterized protein (UPF0335 family)
MTDGLHTTVSLNGGPEIPVTSLRAAVKHIAAGTKPEAAPMFSRKETGEGETMGEAGQTVAAGQLRAFVERIERLEEDKKTIAEDIKEVYAELKGTGFDTKAVRTIIRLRKKDQAERQEEETILDLYKNALGMA